MRTLRYALVLCSIVSSGGLDAQSPAADAAAAALAATRQALGGEQKLAAVKTVVATGRTRQVRGDNLVPIEFEIVMELPDRYARKDEIPAQESGPTIVGFNGDELIQFPAPPVPGVPARAGGPPPPTAEQMEAARKARLAAVKQDFVRLTLGMFASSFTSAPLTFGYVGKAEAPQGKADVLDVKGPGNLSARLFVNAETHLPIMVSWQGPPPSRGGPPPASAGQGPARGGPPPASTGQDPVRGAPPPVPAGQGSARGDAAASGARQGGPPQPPAESRIFFADYRDVGGLQLPFRLRRAVGPDTVEETTFDGFKINAKIDPKKFEVRR